MKRRERIEQTHADGFTFRHAANQRDIDAELRALWAVVDALDRGDDSALSAIDDYHEGQDDG
jgi:hypothetical protein